jgi:hypothetical protein
VIDMRMTHENGVHVSQPGIAAAGDCIAGIVKNPDAGGVFKQQGSVEEAKLSRALP